MQIDESQARLIVLAQAIETADSQRKLLSDAERDQIDSRAASEARKPNDVHAGMGTVLAQRAEMLLEVVRGRNRALDSLENPQHLHHTISWALSLGALILGVVIDRVFNPRRVDLLSEPFLGVLVWNLVVYLLLVLSMFRRREPQPTPLLDALRRWADGAPFWRRGRNALTAEIAVLYFRRWHALTAAIGGQRIRNMMHLAAAAWASGVAMSLIFRGTVKAYTVGWESTLLNTDQVHFILHVLSWPLVRILGIESFTVDDIARLQFDVGAGARGNDGSRWLWLYVGLLLMFVVLPRLALATVAAWRERELAKHIHIDLDEPYFQRIIDNLTPANVRLGVLVHRADDRTVLNQVLVQHGPVDSGRTVQATQKLIGTERGDALWMVDLTTDSTTRQLVCPGAGIQEYGNEPGLSGWRRWFHRASHGETAADAHIDVVLHVVSQAQDLAAALPVLQGHRRPVLMLIRSGGAPDTRAELIEQCKRRQRSHDLAMDILGFEDFARCWVQERTLWNAVARRVPRARAQGCARLIAAWEQRNRMRLVEAMTAIAGSVGYSAHQSEEIPKLSLLDLASSEKRRAQEALRKASMETVLAKVRRRDDEYVQELLSLHGLEASAADDLVFKSEDGKYAVQTSFSAPHAAMGGAATGAAMGASIDLMTGGMTLGAAAALGALAGGSTALVGALWNNRTAPSGGTRISLSDEMVLALLQACLLRYLAVIHLRRDTSGADEDDSREIWKCEVFAEMQKHRKQMLLLIQGSRNGDKMHAEFVSLIEQTGRNVLLRLYPTAGRA